MPTYSVETYDVAEDWGRDGEWSERFAGLSLWGLRGAIRELRGQGYSEVSIYVARSDGGD